MENRGGWKPSTFSFSFAKKKQTKKSLRVFPSLLLLLLLFDSSFPDHAHSPSEALPHPLSAWKGSPRCSASSLVQYYHVLFYFSKEGRKEGGSLQMSERLRVSHGSHVFVDWMRCFKCCGRRPQTSCGLLINRENKILFMALLGQINKHFLPHVVSCVFDLCTDVSCHCLCKHYKVSRKELSDLLEVWDLFKVELMNHWQIRFAALWHELAF